MRRGVLIIAVLSASLVGGCTSATSGSPDHRNDLTVTCRAASGGANRDRDVLLHRVRAIAKDGSVAIAGNTVRLRVPSASRAQATGLCRRGEVALRPLIAPTVRVSSGGHTDPLQSLGFPVPKDETAYARLPVGDQQTLQHRLATAPCTGASGAARPVVACGPGSATDGSSGTSAALLAAPVVDAAGVQKASAQAPQPSRGNTEWTVELDLTASARTDWARYTTAHNTNRSADPGRPTQCGPTVVPCATWVGLVADGKMRSLPVTNEPITGGRVQFAGGFTAASAVELSAALGSGALPVPLTFVSAH